MTSNPDVVAVKDAVGSTFAGGAATSTCRVAVSVAPRSSVTVSVTVYVPSAAYVWDDVFPVPVLPSP